MKWFIVCFCLGVGTCMAQIPPAQLDIRFERPNLSYLPLIDWENYEKMTRNVRIDSANWLRVSVPLERSQVVYVNYLDSTNTIHIHQVFVPRSSHVVCAERNNRLVFEGDTPADRLNRFLQQAGILADDTLTQRPLMRNVSDDLYASMMRDLADKQWNQYLSTQDTTDNTQNTFVKAALEGQNYQRTLFFVNTKNWRDEDFKPDNQQSMFRGLTIVKDGPADFRPPLRIVSSDEAILARDYWFSLITYLRGDIYFADRDDLNEQITAYYDRIDKHLSGLPQTREKLIAGTLRFKWASDEAAFELVKRFERDFPRSKHLREVQFASWSMRKLEKGGLLPPIPILAADSTETTLCFQNGKPMLVLLWNTWEDSCQLALKQTADWSKQFAGKGVQVLTLCAKNRFDSWRDFIAQQWTGAPSGQHFYADYSTTSVLEGQLDARRPAFALFDKTGGFVGIHHLSDRQQVEKWLRLQKDNTTRN